MPNNHLAFAVDFPSVEDALPTLTLIAPHVRFAKVGLELFMREGPPVVERIRTLGFDVFLDLKLHDIPVTVERAVKQACALGVHLVTVHASGGAAMLARAVQCATDHSDNLRIVAVTMLTSLDDSDLQALGINQSPREHVTTLAHLAWEAGVRAFVTSPNEVQVLRKSFGPDAFLVTPGIRPMGTQHSDQKRTATPASAIADGSNLLVVGRPIRDASDPAGAARSIAEDVAAAIVSRST